MYVRTAHCMIFWLL